MRQKSAHRPIFDKRKRLGQIVVGNTPGAPPVVFTCANAITIVGSVACTGLASGGGFQVAYLNDHVFVTNSNTPDAVVSVDVSDPTAPVEVQAFTSVSIDTPRGIAAYGTDYVVIVNDVGDGTLVVIDVTNPAAMSVVGSVTHVRIGSGYDIDVVGDYAYIAGNFNDSIAIVDLSTPSAPSVVGSINSPTVLDRPRGIKVVGNYAYVTAFDDDRLVVVDVSNPASPSIVGNVVDALMDGCWGLTVVDDIAVVGGFNSDRIVCVDVSVPTAPVVLGSYTALDSNGLRDFVNSDTDCDTQVYCTVSISDAVLVVDITDPTDPQVPYNVQGPDVRLDEATGLAINGRYLYSAAIQTGRLTVIELS